MDFTLSRRGFLEGVAGLPALGAASALAQDAGPAQGGGSGPSGERPVVVGSANGWWPEPRPDAAGKVEPNHPSAIARALELLRDAEHMKRPYAALEAIVDGVRLTEDDPNEHSVGLGGLPNEEGVVQLDASCMFGPTHQAGSVAAIENIQNPARVAMYVLRYTDHVMLAGAGAYKFARAFGLPHAELLTEESRKIWLYWKQMHSDRDAWLTPPKGEVPPEVLDYFTHGTIHLSALAPNGDVAAVTTTSGLSYKIPGRVGDSPIVGAGMWCDQEVGSAGSTGRGEECIVNCGAHTIVELMRHGMAPTEACLELLKRIAHKAEKRGLMRNGRPNFGITFYALRNDGAYGSAALVEGEQFAVGDGSAKPPRREKCAWLYDKR